MAKRSPYPKKLKLLPGLKWRGHLTVLSREPEGFAVAFDAESPKADPRERYVFDRAVLTPKQLENWTGWTDDAL